MIKVLTYVGFGVWLLCCGAMLTALTLLMFADDEE